jgi:dephospho-CoA kinase
LTGNIATGKSTVGRMLADLGAHRIDADKVAHQVMRQGTRAWAEIAETFGPKILGEDGEIDRRALGRLVFREPKALETLEDIVHPAVIAKVDCQISRLAAEAEEGIPVVVVEAVKLVEAGMHTDYDALWVVTCPPEVQKARLLKRDNLDEEEIEMRLAAQPPQAHKLALADVVIDNGGSLAQTANQVRAAWHTVEKVLDKRS